AGVEALDLGIARLGQAADGRGYRARHLARARSEEADPAAARRADQERAGRAPVRAAGLHVAARGALTQSARRCRRRVGVFLASAAAYLARRFFRRDRFFGFFGSGFRDADWKIICG